MFGFQYSRQLLLLKRRRTQLGLLYQNVLFISESFTSVGLRESNEKLEGQKNSFAVSYLINSCGLSAKSAIVASQRARLRTPEKPDSVLNLLKENGFANTQISQLVRIQPVLLQSNPDKTLLPKIEFFRSIGISSSELPRILSSNPSLFLRSLENHLIPCYDFLKSVLLVDEKVVITFKRSPRALQQDVTKKMVPNIALLRQIGAPESNISYLVTNFPSVAFMKHDRFFEAVRKVTEMGFDPLKLVFITAVQVLSKMSGPRLGSRFQIYKRFGWPKDVALLAFKRCPNCMLLSDEKITKTMDFLVNKMGWPSTDIAKNPTVVCYSLERRIMPRCSVMEILLAKNLIKSDLCLATFIQPGERQFLDKFVIKFLDRVPELLSIYKDKMELLDVGI